MILVGAAVALFTRWRWAVLVGAVAWPMIVLVVDADLTDLPVAVLLGGANAAVGGLVGAGIRRMARRPDPAG